MLLRSVAIICSLFFLVQLVVPSSSGDAVTLTDSVSSVSLTLEQSERLQRELKLSYEHFEPHIFHNGNAFHYLNEKSSCSSQVRATQQQPTRCGRFDDGAIRVCCSGFFCNFSMITCGTKGNLSFADLGFCAPIPTASCNVTDRVKQCQNSTDLGNVCGCNGKWYCNECEANKALVTVSSTIARCQLVELESSAPQPPQVHITGLLLMLVSTVALLLI